MIEAENFNEGANGVAYWDGDATNNGNAGSYRSTEVDLETTTDSGGGVIVGWAGAPEWLNYTVNVASTGTYSVAVRVASAGDGGTFHIEVNGVDKTGPLTVPNTGGWQTWVTLYKSGITLSAGTQTWRLVLDTNGSTGATGNFNWIAVSEAYGGTPATLPGTVQAENFDEGGSSVAYADNSAGNSGGQYRVTDVDIESTSDTGGGYNVGWASAGEWLKYSVNVTSAGTYNIGVRVASAGQGGTFHIEVNGVDKTGALTVPNTGGWQTWTNVTKTNVPLSAGPQVWRIVMDTNGATNAVGNFNHLTVTASGGPTTTLRLVSFNVQDGGNYQGISGAPAQAQFIASFNPDIVFLQETPEGNHQHYANLLTSITGRPWYASPYTDTSGILSTFPFDEPVERRYLSQSSWGAPALYTARAKITVGGVPLNIWPLHLDIGPSPCYCGGHQDEGMQNVVNWAAESPYSGTRRIIGGDINSWTLTDDQPQLDAIAYIRSHGYIDACFDLPQGYDDYTCPRTNDANWRPDAIYRSSGLSTISQEVHPTDLSDHHLLLTVIQIQ
jgi:endonuclease/exonuclease/phosphatase family metal-dependent hydrolase